MSDEIVKYSNQFNNQALRKFTALDLDLLMAIASRVRDKGHHPVRPFRRLRHQPDQTHTHRIGELALLVPA